jgi:hypothetical protein
MNWPYTYKRRKGIVQFPRRASRIQTRLLFVYYSKVTLYIALQNVHPPKPFLSIWDSSCANKIRVFTWLLQMDRLDVRNILTRKKHKLQENIYNCALCPAH